MYVEQKQLRLIAVVSSLIVTQLVSGALIAVKALYPKDVLPDFSLSDISIGAMLALGSVDLCVGTYLVATQLAAKTKPKGVEI